MKLSYFCIAMGLLSSAYSYVNPTVGLVSLVISIAAWTIVATLEQLMESLTCECDDDGGDTFHREETPTPKDPFLSGTWR